MKPENEKNAMPEQSVPAKNAAKSGRSRKRKRNGVIKLIALLIVLEMLALGPIMLLNGDTLFTLGPKGKQMIKNIVYSSSLMSEARALKTNLKELASAIVAQDLPTAYSEREQVRQNADTMRTLLDTPLYKLAEHVPLAKPQIATARELLQILDEADESLIGPTLELMSAYPLSGIKAEDGIRVEIVGRYLDFAEQKLPVAKEMMQRVDGMDLHLIDSEGKIKTYIEKAEELLKYEELFPLIHAVIGNGEDKIYLFAAQNSSELRASGGFPGSIGSARIHDGILTISNFYSVWDAFEKTTNEKAQITELENKLFRDRLNITWDADYCPDFERVASIWAMAYEDKNDVKVDGVISATPVVIQKLLSFLGSVTLSDGTVLDGENATRVLGHDLYFKYLASTNTKDKDYLESNQVVDDLFDECAQKTFNLLLSGFDVSHFKDYYHFFLDSVNDRSLMIWMADENAQQIIRDKGWSAALGHDAQHPELGIYYNSGNASKMTWYLDIEPTLSEPIVNEDGSRSYDLTVTLSNTMPEEERELAGEYILGQTSGINGVIYVFAPYGGSVSDYQSNYDQKMSEEFRAEQYSDLSLIYGYFTLNAGEPFVLTCRINTAPNVDEPIKLIYPLTMQKYR